MHVFDRLRQSLLVLMHVDPRRLHRAVAHGFADEDKIVSLLIEGFD